MLLRHHARVVRRRAVAHWLVELVERLGPHARVLLAAARYRADDGYDQSYEDLRCVSQAMSGYDAAH
jgi:hypothetical protein